jgi:hypothetical protein
MMAWAQLQLDPSSLHACVSMSCGPADKGIKDYVIKEDDGGVNSVMIYYKNFDKCHNVSLTQ